MKEIIIDSDRLSIHRRGEIVAVNNSSKFKYIVHINSDLEIRLRADEIIEAI